MKYIDSEKITAAIDGIINGLKRNCNPDPMGTREECLAAAELEALELVKSAIDEIKQEEPTTPSIKEESKNCNTIEDFDLILQEMLSTYKKKNADYGNSFAETIQEFGFIPAVARISDKVKRMKNIVKGQTMNYDESLRDALMDAACYCVMTVVELDKENIEKIHKNC